MASRQAKEKFIVEDENGKRRVVIQTTTYETGRLIGGGEMPTNHTWELDDGTPVEAMLGNTDFIDYATGRHFKAVKE